MTCRLAKTRDDFGSLCIVRFLKREVLTRFNCSSFFIVRPFCVSHPFKVDLSSNKLENGCKGQAMKRFDRLSGQYCLATLIYPEKLLPFVERSNSSNENLFI